MVEYHAYDGRLSGETGVNARNITRIENACRDKTTIRFIMMGDTQRHYDETADFVNAVNKRNDIDFVIHGGDISDFGLTKEFLLMRDVMNGLSVPYVVVIGNHDCLANGKEVFHTVFGEENFSFRAGNTGFVCLNTNAMEFDYSHPVPDFLFIEDRLYNYRESIEKTVVVMHAHPYSEQFDNNVAKGFQYAIKQFPGLQFCLHAHDHRVSVIDIFDDGLIYYGSPDIPKREYLLFTLNAGGYEYEVVPF
jgi:predicted phosphodiesterase